jgi:hypothetical protein
MNDKPSNKLSAFALARESFSICAEITLLDVQALRPEWNHDQALAFLRQHGDDLGREMAIHGAALLAAMISVESHGN